LIGGLARTVVTVVTILTVNPLARNGGVFSILMGTFFHS
jgi:hypothetical protein